MYLKKVKIISILSLTVLFFCFFFYDKGINGDA